MKVKLSIIGLVLAALLIMGCKGPTEYEAPTEQPPTPTGAGEEEGVGDLEAELAELEELESELDTEDLEELEEALSVEF